MDAQQKLLTESFLQLPQPKDRVQCQYFWVDGSLRNLRCKSKTWPAEPRDPEELPAMEFCGSATDFDTGDLADYYARPVRLYQDPFRTGSNKLVLCETRTREGLPTFANNRQRLSTSVQEFKTLLDQYSFRQPYTLLRKDGNPVCHLHPAYGPDSKSEFICGREISEAHYRACLYAGVDFTSLEPASNNGQWVYTIGPRPRMTLGDDVWMSRFLLIRVAEDFGVVVSFESTPASKSLVSVTAGVGIDTGVLEKKDQRSVVDALLSKFTDKRVVPLAGRVLLEQIEAYVDPYWVILQVSEAVANSRK